MSTVTTEFYLVLGAHVDKNGWSMGKVTVRTTKSQPALEAHEIAVYMSMKLPGSLFRRPNLKAQITVPDSVAPVVITPELESNITRVLQEQLGITLTVIAPQQEVPS